MITITTPHFVSIRKFAELGVISEYALRKMVKEGRCPGLYSGVKFLINQEALLNLLSVAGAVDSLEVGGEHNEENE